MKTLKTNVNIHLFLAALIIMSLVLGFPKPQINNTTAVISPSKCCSLEILPGDHFKEGYTIDKCDGDIIKAQFFIRNPCEHPSTTLYLQIKANYPIEGSITPVNYINRMSIAPSETPSEITIPFKMPECKTDEYVSFTLTFDTYASMSDVAPCNAQTLAFKVKCISCCQYSMILTQTTESDPSKCLKLGDMIGEDYSFINNNPTGGETLYFSLYNLPLPGGAKMTFSPQTLTLNPGASNWSRAKYFISTQTGTFTFSWVVDVYRVKDGIKKLCGSTRKSKIVTVCPCSIQLQTAPSIVPKCMKPLEIKSLRWYFKNPTPTGTSPIKYSFSNLYNCKSFSTSNILLAPGASGYVDVIIQMPTSANPCKSTRFKFIVKADCAQPSASIIGVYGVEIPVCCCNLADIEAQIVPTEPQAISCGDPFKPKEKEIWIDIRHKCPTGCANIYPSYKIMYISSKGWMAEIRSQPLSVTQAFQRIIIKVRKLSDCSTGTKTYKLKIGWQCGSEYYTKEIPFEVKVVP